MKSRPSLPRLLLASTSPRRRQILESLNLSFEVISPQSEEASAHSENVEEITMENSLLKARSGISLAKHETDIIIGSDTLVVLKDKVMGKPQNREDAFKMLSQLSGQWHRVVTGVALVSKNYGELTTFDTSRIKFKSLIASEIENYVSTKEPYDKAGSYAVQGLGALLIEKIEGSYTNVMGFPIEKFLTELSLFTKISLKEWFS